MRFSVKLLLVDPNASITHIFFLLQMLVVILQTTVRHRSSSWRTKNNLTKYLRYVPRDVLEAYTCRNAIIYYYHHMS